MKRLSLPASALALAMFVGCGGNEVVDLPQKPQIQPDVTALNFGMPINSVCVGARQPQSIQLKNGGKDDLSIDLIEITGTNANLFTFEADSLHSTRPIKVASGTAVVVTVYYAPTSRGQHSAQLEITSNAENHPKLTVSMNPKAVDKTTDPTHCNQ